MLRSCCAFLGPSGGLSRRDGREGRRQKAHSTGGEGSLAIGSPRSSSSNHRFVSGPRSPLRLRQWTHRFINLRRNAGLLSCGDLGGSPSRGSLLSPGLNFSVSCEEDQAFLTRFGEPFDFQIFLSFFVLTAQFPNSAPLLHCFWSVHFSPPGNASCS